MHAHLIARILQEKRRAELVDYAPMVSMLAKIAAIAAKYEHGERGGLGLLGFEGPTAARPSCAATAAQLGVQLTRRSSARSC